LIVYSIHSPLAVDVTAYPPPVSVGCDIDIIGAVLAALVAGVVSL
jgi:hypothetical protein